MKRCTLREAFGNPKILGHALPGPSWFNWRTTLIASRGEELTPAEREVYQLYTERKEPPTEPVRQFAGVVGRKGGKDKAIAAMASYLSTCCSYPMLTKGETGTLLIIAPDQTQATVQLDHIAATLEDSPLLSKLVTNRTSDSIVLSNGIKISVRSSNYRRLRGLTAIAVIASETAFYYSEGSANPDVEILTAVKPMLLTTKGCLYQISSPYAKSGTLWQLYDQHYGPDGDPSVMVVQGTTLDFNPTIDPAEIDRELQADPSGARAEYLGEFRSDLESFIPLEVVRACVDQNVTERAPAGHRYFGFTDAAGGSGQDSMTLAIGHREDERVIVDLVREARPPFSPEAVVDEFAADLKRYGVTTIASDFYAAEWPREQFRKRGITVEKAAKTTSDHYREMLPLLNTRNLRLLDNARLVDQIAKLERHTGGAGKDTITHRARVGHDDIAASVAGMAYRAKGGGRRGEVSVSVVGPYGGVITPLGGGRVDALSADRGGCNPSAEWTRKNTKSRTSSSMVRGMI